MSRLLNHIQSWSWGRLALYFSAVVFIRQFLEFAFSFPASGNLLIDFTTYIHSLYFFAALLLVTSIILHKLLQEPVTQWLKFFIALTPALFFAPLTNGLIYGRYAAPMVYLFVPIGSISAYLISFFGPLGLTGVTLGNRVQALALIVLVISTVYKKTRSLGEGIVAAIISYTAIFLFAAAPSFIIGFTAPQIFGSLSNSYFRFLPPSLPLVPTAFNLFMGQFWWLTICFSFYYLLRTKIKTLFTKQRLGRLLLHFLLPLTVFILPSFVPHAGNISLSSFTQILFLLAVITCGWIYAFTLNDLSDSQADDLVHPERALQSGTIDRTELKAFSIGAGVLFALGITVAGSIAWPLLLYGFITTIYSVPGIMLRRFVALNQALMAASTLCLVSLGQILFGAGSMTALLPDLGKISLLFFSLWFLKDVLDMVGDKAAGYFTLMTIFGDRKGRLITWLFIATALLILIFNSSHERLFLLIPTHLLLGLFLWRNWYRDWQLGPLMMLYTVLILA